MRFRFGFAIMVLFMKVLATNLELHSPEKPRYSNSSTPDNISVNSQERYIYEDNEEVCERVFDIFSDMVEVFMRKLKLYVRNKTLDTSKFNLASDQLRKELQQMETFANSINPCSKNFSERINFAKFFFFKLEDAVFSLDFYRLPGDMGQSLVHRLIQFNLRLIALRDSQGDPDTEVKNFDYIVSNLQETLTHWGLTFMHLRSLPLSVWLMFRSEFTLAQTQIMILGRQNRKYEPES